MCVEKEVTKVGEQHQAYCFKCRTKAQIKNHEHVTLKNSRLAIRGVCPTCGTKVSRIGQG